MTPPDSLQLFHPVVRTWFGLRYGRPTPVQQGAWPIIAAGSHLLATAPTGSGKTLAAFLWALDRLMTGAWESGRVRVLYISPLKALNNDIQRNLLEPLGELERAFEEAGVPYRVPRVATRSGDTPSSERQRMVRRPPEILITTPESLNILLTSQGGRSMLEGLETVILDEVHAVVSGKRGTHLVTAVDRLVLLSGEFQRLALSATVRPIEPIARFVAGWRLDRRGDTLAYEPRPIELLEGTSDKRYEVQVDFPNVPPQGAGRATGGVERPTIPIPRARRADPESQPPATEMDPDLLWAQLTRRLKAIVKRNRSTLIFANSRRLAERVAHLINEGEPTDLVYSHHGSLSREIRTTVEEHFKAGKLAGIVATNSLEMGIDIGDLDEVVLLQTPFSIASAIQRIGRAGHAVGEVSRGTFHPLFGRDLIAATVMSRAVADHDLEPIRPVRGALDVLAQVILSMTSAEEWPVDALYEQIRTSEPYHRLSRRHFDLVLEMLAGRYAATRLRELTPRLHWNRLEGTVRARRGATHLLYTSGGTIPDRGYYQLRLQGSLDRIGELDEEFVWERKINDRFALGTQTWRVVQITHQDVIVTPAGGPAGLAPFWRGEVQARDAHLADRLGSFLEWAEGRLSERGREAGSLRRALLSEYPLAENAADTLLQLLEAQRAATGSALPHRRHLLVERVRDPQKATAAATIILHTGWGGRVNRPFALALAAAWEERFGTIVDVTQDDDGVMINAPHEVASAELLDLVPGERIEVLLRARLETSGFFGARFRENAGRSLLLPRAGFARRVPLWLNRQRAKKLLENVAASQDFPVVLETWRTCLQDEFDLEALRARLEELAHGQVEVTDCVTTAPSPFAAGLSWNLTSQLMYEDDRPEGGAGSALGMNLLRDLIDASDLSARVQAEAGEELRAKLQRIAPDYAPRPGVELVEWVKERLLLSALEWDELVDAVARDAGCSRADILAHPEVGERLVALVAEEGSDTDEPQWILALESLRAWWQALAPSLSEADLVGRIRPISSAVESAHETLDLTRLPPSEASSTDVLSHWLSFYPPLPSEELARRLGSEIGTVRAALEPLTEDGSVVEGPLVAGHDEPHLCDAENLERLLRLARRSRQPSLEPIPVDQLPHFLAVHQGIAPQASDVDGLQAALETLFGYSAPAATWESDLLPARLDPYRSSWLDSLMQEGELVWHGTGERKLTFLLHSDLDLLAVWQSPDDSEGTEDESDDPHLDPEATSEGHPNPPADSPSRASDPTLDPAAIERSLIEALGRGAALTVGELARATALRPSDVETGLWRLAWQGRSSNDSFSAVRRGVSRKFQATSPTPRPTSGRGRTRRTRWRGTPPHVGRWMLLPGGASAKDNGEAPGLLENQAAARERARIVLHRYGIVFRSLLSREAPGFRWSDLFPSLRLMELSGEILSGHFFSGISGPQFATRRAVRTLRRGLPEDLIYWMSALDPAAPCGLGLTWTTPPPRRLAGNHLVYQGSRLALVSERRGQRLTFHVPPDHPHLADYLEPLRRLLEAPGQASVEVEEINGEPARESPYRSGLAAHFHLTAGARTLRLWRRY